MAVQVFANDLTTMTLMEAGTNTSDICRALAVARALVMNLISSFKAPSLFQEGLPELDRLAALALPEQAQALQGSMFIYGRMF